MKHIVQFSGGKDSTAMPLCLNYIKAIHSVKESAVDGFVIVDANVAYCWGRTLRGFHAIPKEQWEIDKKNGFFVG